MNECTLKGTWGVTDYPIHLRGVENWGPGSTEDRVLEQEKLEVSGVLANDFRYVRESDEKKKKKL